MELCGGWKRADYCLRQCLAGVFGGPDFAVRRGDLAVQDVREFDRGNVCAQIRSRERWFYLRPGETRHRGSDKASLLRLLPRCRARWQRAPENSPLRDSHRLPGLSRVNGVLQLAVG